MGDSPRESFGGEVSSLVEQAKDLQEAAASLISRTSREEDALRQRAASLDSRINSLRSSKHDDTLEDELVRARYVLSEGDAAAYLPSKSHGRFLRMFLGAINVRANRKDVQLKVKEEYNNFRNVVSVPVFSVFAASPKVVDVGRMLTCIASSTLPGLALRENILRVNGSDIRPWWIKHHYCAMAMALISLTWETERGPDCAQKQRGVELFLRWAIMQGVAMILQNRYQRQRLYTRIALGKARRMDVVWGETAGVEGQLLLLCPILFVLQGFEAYVGVLLLKTALSGFSPDWQVITCGILFIIMAVGNFANTVQTLATKSKVKAKIRKGKSRQELNSGSEGKSL
ncbi:transmembrane protein 120 homolog isoform X2 [Salvia splendens]|uniref:transmembrane protein 120 homolog isoform X2 n=1 Tax=Salvia splendens TaxID=180675 RepID=UPI001C2618E5|nr:transmembrane protein 120 homolog isoform X2 [Salvia splendens]